MTRRIAVTGGTGFVGKHVCRKLLEADCDLVITGRNVERVDEFRGRATIVQASLESLCDDGFATLGKPDVLIHLAWGGLPDYRAMRHIEAELPLNIRFLKSMVADGLKAVIVAGTCFEYGMQSGPVEETATCDPVTAYGLAKHTLHRTLELSRTSLPFELTWARIFYPYGSGQPERSLWSQLNAAIDRGDASFGMSAGEQLRDFLPVETVAEHLAAIALAGSGLGTINICSGQPRSVRGIVDEWVARRGAHISLDLGHYPYPDYEPMAFWGSDAKLRAALRDLRLHRRGR
jgi:dTDP-6-deoxy-L-talose 4-dehydrogenase (NAD+)